MTLIAWRKLALLMFAYNVWPLKLKAKCWVRHFKTVGDRDVADGA